jgi:hypothetical protein
MTYDKGWNGVIFRVTEDGKVSIGDYERSPSYEMQSKIQPLIERVAPKVREYCESLLMWEMEKR